MPIVLGVVALGLQQQLERRDIQFNDRSWRRRRRRRFRVSPLSTFSTTSNDLTLELRTSPTQPPLVGPGSSGQLRVTDSATGARVDGLTISITTWMPVMGHECTAARIDVKPQGNGVYLASPFEPSMPGDCEWILKISSTGPEGGVIADKATTPRFTVAQ